MGLGAQAGGEGGRGAAAQLPLRGVQPGEDGRLGERLAVQLVAGAAVHLVEVARPGAAAGHRLLGQHLLLPLGQQVGPVHAGDLQPVPPGGERRAVHERPRRLLGGVRPLQLQEEQLLAQPRAALVGLLQQGAEGGLVGPGGPAEVGEGAHPAGQVQQRLVAAQQPGQLAGRERGDPAAELGGQPVGQAVRLREVALQGGVLRGGIQAGEVPGDPLGPGGSVVRHGRGSFRLLPPNITRAAPGGEKTTDPALAALAPRTFSVDPRPVRDGEPRRGPGGPGGGQGGGEGRRLRGGLLRREAGREPG